jgi:NAD-dependent SIR2 family protein deacetylase
VHHPEIEGPLGDALAEFSKQELVDVYCKGCGAFRKMNAVYAKYLQGEINNCPKCKGLKLEP